MQSQLVMAVLVPAIHDCANVTVKIVDARHKAGHDESEVRNASL